MLILAYSIFTNSHLLSEFSQPHIVRKTHLLLSCLFDELNRFCHFLIYCLRLILVFKMYSLCQVQTLAKGWRERILWNILGSFNSFWRSTGLPNCVQTDILEHLALPLLQWIPYNCQLLLFRWQLLSKAYIYLGLLRVQYVSFLSNKHRFLIYL